jgi:hypothetical protein
MTLPSLVALLLTLAAAPRGAPSADEQRLYADGLKAFGAGDAAAAERAWREGYAVGHDPAFLVHIGEAQEKAGAPAQAAESYRRYLREAPDASDRADIEQRVAKLSPGRPGPGAVAAGATGAGATATTTSAPAEKAEAVGDFGAGPPREASPPAAPAPAAAPAAVVAVDAEGRPAAEDDDSGWTRANITAWSASAATALLLGTAAYFGAQAASKASDVNRLVTFRDMDTGAPVAYSPAVARQYESAFADGKRFQRDARIVLVGAAATALTATVFFIIDGTRPARGGVAVLPASHGAGALGAWSWRF